MSSDSRTGAVRRVRAVIAAGVVLLGSACGGSGGVGSGTESGDATDWSPEAIALPDDAPVQPSIAVGPVAVGQQRLAFGLVDLEGSLVDDAEVEASFWALTETDTGFTGAEIATRTLDRVVLPQDYTHEHADGTDHIHDARDATVYVTDLHLDRAGWWGAELEIVTDDERLDPVRVPFRVEADTPEPAVGEPIPASRQLTTADVDISRIDSADPPRPELHDVTIADALELGKPLVVGFATAAFCQTQFCGPVLDGVIVPLSDEFGDQIEFIVVEPFDLARAGQGQLVPVPIMAEWGLSTEPWVFVTDDRGVVTHRFQGITSLDEVRGAVEAVLATD